jgi:hypothetical protein
MRHIFARDVPTAPVVQSPAVVRLRDKRVDGAHLFVAGKREHVIEQRIGGARHAQSRSQNDGRLDLAEFFDLRRTHQLAEAVADEDCARHFLLKQIARMRQDGGDAGANVRAANDGRVADAHAGHVRNRIERARRQNADAHADLSGAWPRGAIVRLAEAGNCQTRQRKSQREEKSSLISSHRIVSNIVGLRALL